MRTKARVLAAGVFLSVLLTAPDLFAAAAGMPWEGPLDTILNSITGNVARVVGVIIITLTGFAMAFGEAGSGVRKLLGIVFGLSIAFTASSFFLSFLGYGGGLLIP